MLALTSYTKRSLTAGLNRRFDAIVESHNEGDHEVIVRHAEAMVNAAEQGAELSER